MSNDLKAIRPPARNLSRPRADTTTPLPDTLGKAPLADVPEPPKSAEPEKPKAPRAFSFSTEIVFKGRVITVHADGMTLSEFSALLDLHGFAPVTE
jgi:hypothetical protein